MTFAARGAVMLVLAGSLLGARAYINRFGSPFEVPPPPPVDLAAAHLDHAPRHGGLVLMNEDTHFEVIVDPDGNCRVYFTDAVRNPLPPSYASQVSLAISGGGTRQAIALAMDSEANAWVGRAEPVDDPQAIVRVFYETRGERPYWIDLPLSALRGGAAAAPPVAP